MAPPPGAVLLVLLVLTRYYGDARPRLHGNSCSPPAEVLIEALGLLRNVGPTFPASCYYDHNNITLPGNISTYHIQCSSVLRLVHAALQGAELVFQQQQPSLGEGGVLWDEKNLDDFQNVLHRILRHHCFSQTNSSGLMESYFSNVTALLQRQDVCGWYVLRRDLIYVLRTSLHRHKRCFHWSHL